MAYVTPGGFKWDTVHEKMKLLKCKKYQKPNIKISIEIEQRQMSQPRRHEIGKPFKLLLRFKSVLISINILKAL